MSCRESFVARFGEDDARRMEAAASMHAPDQEKGSDPFRWAVLICIGWQCFEKFRYYHGFDASHNDIKAWVKANVNLDDHDGEIDSLGLFCNAHKYFS